MPHQCVETDHPSHTTSFNSIVTSFIYDHIINFMQKGVGLEEYFRDLYLELELKLEVADISMVNVSQLKI